MVIVKHGIKELYSPVPFPSIFNIPVNWIEKQFPPSQVTGIAAWYYRNQPTLYTQPPGFSAGPITFIPQQWQMCPPLIESDLALRVRIPSGFLDIPLGSAHYFGIDPNTGTIKSINDQIGYQIIQKGNHVAMQYSSTIPINGRFPLFIDTQDDLYVAFLQNGERLDLPSQQRRELQFLLAEYDGGGGAIAFDLNTEFFRAISIQLTGFNTPCSITISAKSFLYFWDTTVVPAAASTGPKVQVMLSTSIVPQVAPLSPWDLIVHIGEYSGPFNTDNQIVLPGKLPPSLNINIQNCTFQVWGFL